MRSDLTDITMVIDRSGSMAHICSDAEGGINTFIESQKAEPGETLLTLVQFDTEYEFVHNGVPINNVPKYKLLPRGSTALLDAVGRAVNETGSRLAAMEESQRPGLVVFVIVTDGHENASQTFTHDKIREMIEHQQSVYSWKFTFLAANQDAFAEAASIGIDSMGAANFSPDKMQGAYRAMAKKMSRMRLASHQGETVQNTFTEEERDEML